MWKNLSNTQVLIFLICLIIILTILRFFIGQAEQKKLIFKVGNGSGNDDAETYRIKKDEGIFFLTSEVGPRRNRQIASTIARNIILERFDKKNDYEITLQFLKNCCLESHSAIIQQPTIQNGGCSVVIAFVKDKMLNWVSSGDISIYLYRNQLKRLNKRDLYRNFLREKILKQEISESKVFVNTLKDEITSYLGYENFKKVELNKNGIRLEKKDKVLLCTKEFEQTFSRIEIEKMISSTDSVENRTKEIQNRINQKENNHQLKFLIVEQFK